MSEHRVHVLSSGDGAMLTDEEYDFLLVEEYLHRLGSGESLEGFVRRLDHLHKDITEDLADGGFDDQETEIIKSILAKIGNPRPVWLYVE